MTRQLQAVEEKKEGVVAAVGWGGAGRTRTKHNGELCTEDETPWETKGGDITGCGSSVFGGVEGGGVNSRARGSRDTGDDVCIQPMISSSDAERVISSPRTLRAIAHLEPKARTSEPTGRTRPGPVYIACVRA